MKSKYESHVLPRLKQIKAWAEKGLSEKQIAKNLGISKDSLIEYKKKYADFSDALARAKITADQEVENALYKRAIGFECVEVTQELKLNPATGRQQLIITKEVTKHIVGDVEAQKFWLANRQRDRWSYKPEGNAAGDNGAGGVIQMPEVIAPGDADKRQEPVLQEPETAANDG